MGKNTEQYESRRDYSILFADIKGFTSLKPFQQRLFIGEVLSRIANAACGGEDPPEQANTWGDGLVAFYSSHTNAVRCALTLRDTFRRTQWKDIGLPPLEIRIALHIGEVFEGHDPVRNTKGLIGTEINRAARLEPVVAPNHVYATTDFVNLCHRMEDVQFQPLGKVVLHEGWGAEEIHVVGWREHEILDPDQIKGTIHKGLA